MSIFWTEPIIHADLWGSRFAESGKVGYHPIENFIRNNFCILTFFSKGRTFWENSKKPEIGRRSSPPEVSQRGGGVNFLWYVYWDPILHVFEEKPLFPNFSYLKPIILLPGQYRRIPKSSKSLRLSPRLFLFGVYKVWSLKLIFDFHIIHISYISIV